MGRFDHLEMGNWRPPQAEAEQKPKGVLDQDYYLGKARDSFAAESYETALAFYSRTLQYEISIEEAWLGQLRCLIEMGELPEAIVWSNRALERFPKSAAVLSARAVAEARTGRLGAAMGYSDSAFAAQGVDSYAWVARGDVLIGANQVNAKACFAKAVELSPNDWATRAWIGRAYLLRKQYHQALTHLNQAVRLDPERFTCWYWIGRCHSALGQTEQAMTAHRRSLGACSGFTPAQTALRELEGRGTMSKIVDGVKRLFGRRPTNGG